MIELKVYALSAVSNIPAMVYWVLLSGLIVGFPLLKRVWGGRTVPRLLLAEWVLMVFCVTAFFRHEDETSSINLLPFWSYFRYQENSYLEEMAAINLLNVVMFVPVGFLLKCGFPAFTWKRILFAGCLLSVSIEICQFIFNKGLCEIDDVIHNVAGGMIGYGLAKLTLLIITSKGDKKVLTGKFI